MLAGASRHSFCTAMAPSWSTSWRAPTWTAGALSPLTWRSICQVLSSRVRKRFIVQSAVQPFDRRVPPIGLANPVAARFATAEPVKDLAGVRFDEGVRVGLVGGDVNSGGIEVIEVDLADDVFGDAGGQRDSDPVAFAALGIPGALAAQMGGVREVAPRNVLELLPLAEEVVAVVVADRGDVRMHHRHLSDVGSVEDHLATMGDDRLELVKTLRRGPDVLVLGRHD